MQSSVYIPPVFNIPSLSARSIQRTQVCSIDLNRFLCIFNDIHTASLISPSSFVLIYVSSNRITALQASLLMPQGSSLYIPLLARQHASFSLSHGDKPRIHQVLPRLKHDGFFHIFLERRIWFAQSCWGSLDIVRPRQTILLSSSTSSNYRPRTLDQFRNVPHSFQCFVRISRITIPYLFKSFCHHSSNG